VYTPQSQFFFSETISQLERHIACASADHLVGASQRTPIHGPAAGHPLHMIQDVNFKTLKATNVDASTDGGGSKQIADWRRLLLGRLLACLTRKATNLVLPITCPRASAPEGLTSAQTIPEVRTHRSHLHTSAPPYLTRVASCVTCVSCVVCRVSCVVCRVSCVVCRVSCVVRPEV
jgi:hypothetical protein